ncbi:hypothetical protein [Prochlorothrix hollandica]|uniref:hypothetical protein n=1 Tax=Prochlorothrix hollandica TaxID=1223 RepID=UPI0033421F44
MAQPSPPRSPSPLSWLEQPWVWLSAMGLGLLLLFGGLWLYQPRKSFSVDQSGGSEADRLSTDTLAIAAEIDNLDVLLKELGKNSRTAQRQTSFRDNAPTLDLSDPATESTFPSLIPELSSVTAGSLLLSPEDNAPALASGFLGLDARSPSPAVPLNLATASLPSITLADPGSDSAPDLDPPTGSPFATPQSFLSPLPETGLTTAGAAAPPAPKLGTAAIANPYGNSYPTGSYPTGSYPTSPYPTSPQIPQPPAGLAQPYPAPLTPTLNRGLVPPLPNPSGLSRNTPGAYPGTTAPTYPGTLPGSVPGQESIQPGFPGLNPSNPNNPSNPSNLNTPVTTPLVPGQPIGNGQINTFANP